ncbi:N-acetylglucosaminyl-phosphatidylinositol de-N-acetylase-like [Camellia sinensis]|uniref:N-acetylglucosaminyl-phosphatidylinositol de-N-acetylase-like n=1 Tax=Camellia sinensis TaxID=4442 RepID=UPI001035A15D|nr:N-acetylglucosaminyl-phosphatidylinositol de-N-acetylase-like [Camellia sinensis]
MFNVVFDFFSSFSGSYSLWLARLVRRRQQSTIRKGRIFLFSSLCFDLGAGLRRKNALLVIAHPDDESMFFTPTINYLTSGGHNLHIVCISTGNADGMGNIRKEELYQVSAVLKVPLQQVKILDRPDLQDGFGKVWRCDLLARIIEEEILSHAIDLIITFDNYGVSGHCNHRDVNQGIRTLLGLNEGLGCLFELGGNDFEIYDSERTVGHTGQLYISASYCIIKYHGFFYFHGI